MLTKRDYEEALFTQGACNLSGLAHSLSALCTRIWAEARETGKGTEYVNTHPTVRLYLEQMYFLASGRDYFDAMRTCEERAQGGQDAIA